MSVLQGELEKATGERHLARAQVQELELTLAQQLREVGVQHAAELGEAANQLKVRTTFTFDRKRQIMQQILDSRVCSFASSKQVTSAFNQVTITEPYNDVETICSLKAF